MSKLILTVSYFAVSINQPLSLGAELRRSGELQVLCAVYLVYSHPLRLHPGILDTSLCAALSRCMCHSALILDSASLPHLADGHPNRKVIDSILSF